MFGEGKVMKGVRGLEIRGGPLGIVEAFVNHGKEFHSELQPGLTREDGIWGVEWGGEGLTGASQTM